MPLTPGARIGPYEIVAPLGAGGMGEVYRATDTRLDRDVAIKILPAAFAQDADRLARFQREAKTLAALNHPNIAQIYGVESDALIMELVEGEDLSAHVARGPMALADALPIVRQIIAALEAAHDQGIVHRDLKPQNIKVTEDGAVKVLDFGLAKALTPDSDAGAQDSRNSPTLTAVAFAQGATGTQMGVILGTASYMSPEQARGRAVDRRTDVWALGCVLYEMLTAAKAFGGEDATEIISAVVKSEPDLTALPATVPPHVRAVVERCLVKDRKARIPDMSVVRYLLDGAVDGSGVASAARPGVAARPRTWLWPAVAMLSIVTTLAVAAAWYLMSSPEPAIARFVIAPPLGATFASGAFGAATVPALSPDGRSVAFTARDASGRRMLYVRPIDAILATPLPGTDGASYPFWSPDSRHIGFSVFEKLMRVPVTGGPPETICALRTGITSRGGAWSRDGIIVFNNGPRALSRVPAAGGTPVDVGALAEDQSGRQFPAFLPDGRHFLFHTSGLPTVSGVHLGSLDSLDTTRLTSSDTGAVYDAQSGQVLFVREGMLMAQALDLKSRVLTGDPVRLASHVESGAVPGVVAFSVSDTGVLAYGVGQSATSGYRLTWLDRQGKVLGTVGPEAQYRGVSLSPDGSQAAVHRHDGEGGDVWLIDLARNAPSRFTTDPTQENSFPVWSPTGDRLAFQSTRDGKDGIHVRPSTGGGADDRLVENTTGTSALPLGWSRGGTLLFGARNFGREGVKTGLDLWTVSLDGQRKVAPRVQTAANELSGQYSPDGKWLAYQSNETGPSEIYVQSETPTARRWVVSTGGGNAPRWRGDSQELYYLGAGKVWAVTIGAGGDAPGPGVPRSLFDYPGVANANHSSYFYSYDVMKDGSRFLTTRRESDNNPEIAAAPLVVVLNWRHALTSGR